MPSSTASTLRLSLRVWLGLGIMFVGVACLMTEAATQVWASEPTRLALLAGCVAASATALGTLPVLVSRQFSQWAHDTILGFGAGVMLAATSFSLVLPALESAKALGASPWAAGGVVGVGVFLGASAILLLDRAVPHDRFDQGVAGPASRKLKRIWLFVFAIVLHNVPEGMAIGVAFAGPDPSGGVALTTGISIQDAPEGLVVALALRSIGFSRWQAAGAGLLSGVVEPVAAVLAATLVELAPAMLPWGLSAAAGAMLFVISHELIPESHRQGHQTYATCGLIIGFVAMMILDTSIG